MCHGSCRGPCRGSCRGCPRAWPRVFPWVSAAVAVGFAMGVPVDLLWLSADVSVDKSVGVFVGMSVGVSVGFAVGASMDLFVGDRGLPWYAMGAAVDLAVKIAAEVAMASAMGLHGVPLLATAFRGSPWNVRGSPWNVRGSPWKVHGREVFAVVRGTPWTWPRNAVEVRGDCCRAPPKRQIIMCLSLSDSLTLALSQLFRQHRLFCLAFVKAVFKSHSLGFCFAQSRRSGMPPFYVLPHQLYRVRWCMV